jgi:uncharacterized protein
MHIDGKRLVEILSSGASTLVGHQHYLDSINYYPVPDADTGTNMHKTMMPLSIHQDSLYHSSVSIASQAIADSILMTARGNSGAILAQFFQGLAEGLREVEIASFTDFVKALVHASQRAKEAVLEPVEGTILTVMREWTLYLKNNVHDPSTYKDLLKASLDIAETSLKKTMKQLQVLKKMKQVDAGAQGFVYFVQGLVDAILHGHAVPGYSKDAMRPIVLQSDFDFEGATHQYCTEVIVAGDELPLATIKKELPTIGDSIVVIGNSKKAKIHIHTDQPGQVFSTITQWGTIVQEKIDDMYQQMRDMKAATKRKICIVVDSTFDIEPALMKHYNIHILPLHVKMKDMDHLDPFSIDTDTFYSWMKTSPYHPTTSQVSLADAERMFKWTSKLYDHTIALTIAKVDSGTYQSVSKAAEMVSPDTITVIDTKTGSGASGLLALEAAQSIELGESHTDIINNLYKKRPKAELLIAIKTLKHLFRGGRLSKSLFYIGKALGLQPIITADSEGKLIPFAKVLGGRKKVLKRLLSEVFKKTSSYARPKFIISHANEPEEAQWIKDVISEKNPSSFVSVTTMGPVLGSHAGPGTIVVSWLP